jgi:Transposase
MACILETTHGLLIAALLEAGFAVYPVNPRTVERRRKPSGAKTDAIDAYLLAKTGRSDLPDLRRLQPDAAQIQELKALTHDQDALIQSQTRLVVLPWDMVDNSTSPCEQVLCWMIVIGPTRQATFSRSEALIEFF